MKLQQVFLVLPEPIDNLTMLIEDKVTRKKMGENGIKKIQENFNWERLLDDFNKDILKLVHK